MNKLCFMNDGYFDPRLMLTFGVSAKVNDSPVGYFGTGFKYAIAIILRLGGRVKVMTRDEEDTEELYEFTRHTETIRGQEFDVVKINGNDAHFSTRLGINWEPWMAYRELRCNCLDEKGKIGEVGDALQYQTVVMVECEEILRAHNNSSNYFIEGAPVWKNNEVEIYEGSRPFIYYRGVAVQNMPQASAFSYNILARMDLTEERLAMYNFQSEDRIIKAFKTMEDERIIRTVLTSENKFDRAYDFDTSVAPSEAFKQVAFETIKTGTNKNESARKAMQKIEEAKAEYQEKKLNKAEAEMLGRAIRFLCALDIPVNEYRICPVVKIGNNVLGRALNGKIYITEQAFMMGTKQVASTLMEEWVHLRHECADFSRTMQNWLFDKILSIAENINGEPL